MERTVDVAIVGAGSAGLTAMGVVRRSTENFVLINEGPYGTVCARVGCMPSKALIQSANDFHRRHQFGELGIQGGDGLSVDLPAVMRRVRRLRDGFVSRVLPATENLPADKRIDGRARFLEPNLLEVNGERIRAKAVVFAAGSRPVVPPAWAEFGERILTSDQIFELEEPPQRLAVVGLGVIGLELGQALARLGVEVVGIEMADTLGGLSDPEVGAKAKALLGSEMPLHFGAQAELSPADQGIEVNLAGERLTVDAVLAAMGRRPNVDDCGLENLGVALDDRGLPAFDPQTMQVGDLPVFIAGDVNGQLAILHEASDEGRIAGWNALHGDQPTRFARRAPLAIAFTEPEIALVGQRWADLKDRDDVVSAGFDFGPQGRALIAAENHGLMRLYAERGSRRLLGAEMIAPRAEHLAHELSWAMQAGLTVMEMIRLPAYHPVLEEGMREGLRQLVDQLDPPDRFEMAPAD